MNFQKFLGGLFMLALLAGQAAAQFEGLTPDELAALRALNESQPGFVEDAQPVDAPAILSDPTPRPAAASPSAEEIEANAQQVQGAEQLPEDVEQTTGTEPLRQFGYELFAGTPTTFAPANNIPVPLNYVVGPSDTAIMQPNVTDTFTLQADDINGANALYGVKAARDDQGSNVLASIYGINVLLPSGTELSVSPQSAALTGALESSDGILNARYIDIYQYTLSQGTLIDIRLESSQFDSLLYLVRMDSTQRPIPAETFTDDNSGGNFNARLVKALSAGTYWIGASSAAPGGRGAYSLNFNTGSGTPTTFPGYVSKYGIPVQINPNAFISGDLGGSDKRLKTGSLIDLYEFSVKESVTLQIDLSSTAMDTMLHLARVLPNQDLDSSLYFQDDNGGGGTSSRLTKTLPPGTYWIGASSASAVGSGAYQISVFVRP